MVEVETWLRKYSQIQTIQPKDFTVKETSESIQQLEENVDVRDNVTGEKRLRDLWFVLICWKNHACL